MRELHMTRHRRRRRRPQSLIKHTLQPKFRHALFPINLHPHLKQSIRIPDSSLQGGVSAPHDNRFRRFGHDFEMVCYLCADVVRGI
jgi:hypothetical protein